MFMKNFILFLLLIASIDLSAQQYTIKGIVKDNETGTQLAFANIRVLDSFTGTAANRRGSYELKLKPGEYFLVASYIGYYSDTAKINLDRNLNEINFSLTPAKIELQEVTVTPGENPAVGVIRKAIARKNERNNLINSYELEAYTKGLIKSDQEISARDRSVSISFAGSDSSNLFISGIIENQSKGFFKKPDKFKEIITARKQSANLPSSINILTGGRFIQNFYDDEVRFMGNIMKSPLADDALNYYYFVIEEMAALDDVPVYKIYMTPDNNSDPGFQGHIFITDSTFDLIKVDLQLNRAANTGGIFDTINVFQQFSLYDGIYMPADYRLYAAANILNLAKIGFEMNTILYNYKINNEINESVFNKAIITVLPLADDRDSLYWENIQSIPNTDEEQLAYRRIDSLDNIPVTFWDNFSILSTRIGFGDYFSVTGPLSIYHFNSVEGHSLDFGFYGDDLFKERLRSSLFLSYGFADKRFKTAFSSRYLFGDYRTGKVELSLYKTTRILFGESVGYNELTSTLLALLSKYEFRDYYYSTGARIDISEEVLPVLRLNIGYNYNKDISANKHTEFSFFARDKIYKENQQINDAEINSFTAGFTIDFRDYIEDGLYRRRTSQGKSYVLLSGGVSVSDDKILNTTSNFTMFTSNINGQIRSYRSTFLNYTLYGLYSRGNVPYQSLYSLPGNINLTAINNSFRTLNVNEVVGDRVATANLEYNFRDEIFRMLRIPFLKDSEIQFKIFLNSAIAYISGNSVELPGIEIKEFRHPFYETGFSLGHVLFPMEFNFSWKLNYRDGNNFRFGIGTFIY
jgi:hypothetical protein